MVKVKPVARFKKSSGGPLHVKFLKHLRGHKRLPAMATKVFKLKECLISFQDPVNSERKFVSHAGKILHSYSVPFRAFLSFASVHVILLPPAT
jgi:hypothetical protein